MEHASIVCLRTGRANIQRTIITSLFIRVSYEESGGRYKAAAAAAAAVRTNAFSTQWQNNN